MSLTGYARVSISGQDFRFPAGDAGIVKTMAHQSSLPIRGDPPMQL